MIHARRGAFHCYGTVHNKAGMGKSLHSITVACSGKLLGGGGWEERGRDTDMHVRLPYLSSLFSALRGFRIPPFPKGAVHAESIISH